MVQASKPLLMPMLAWLLWQQFRGKNEKNWRIIFWGLLASWMGDILLMKGDEPLFFIAGLSSFLVTHVLYIFYFLKYTKGAKTTLLVKRPGVLLAAAYAAILLYWLIPSLASMLVPVLIYTTVITLMLIAAMATQNRLRPGVWFWFVGGAILFVISDSVLAFNKFHTPVPFAGICIMSTYGIAQWMVMTGTLLNQDAAAIHND